MKSHALQVIPDDAVSFRWQLLQPGDVALAFEPHSHSDDVFADYESALNAGTLALAATDDRAYENESSDPVGDIDSGVRLKGRHEKSLVFCLWPTFLAMATATVALPKLLRCALN